jgi:UV DNA damage endonuclease
MKIGYPCVNRTIGCTGSAAFRLVNWSEKRFHETVVNNLDCVDKMLLFNAQNGLLFFRISSDVVPFASHPVCGVDWARVYGERLRETGGFIKKSKIRVSMHPDQFVLLNALDETIVEKSVAELAYHAKFLDTLGLDHTAKIQIHVGGAYGDKKSAMLRFVKRYRSLDSTIKNRLVIENDDHLYSVKDCMAIHRATGVPVLLDVFHHTLNNNGEPVHKAIVVAHDTWKKHDGLPMVDYSSQKKGKRPGSHAESIGIKGFSAFLKMCEPMDFDLMLEIKDKEKSALKAVKAAAADPRLVRLQRRPP